MLARPGLILRNSMQPFVVHTTTVLLLNTIGVAKIFPFVLYFPNNIPRGEKKYKYLSKDPTMIVPSAKHTGDETTFLSVLNFLNNVPSGFKK